MKKYKIPKYTEMLLNNELKSYLLNIDNECREKVERLLKQIEIYKEIEKNRKTVRYVF